MALLCLPEEILLIIFKQLEVESIINLYETCKYFRHLICMHAVVQECKLSLNTMATAKTLKLSFFKDISRHLKELNLCGVPDLCQTAFLPATKRLKNLKVLDVSYTKITLSDFIEILQVCPTIKDIAINYNYGKRYSATMDNQKLMPFHQAFQHLKNVHFIGLASDLLYSVSPLFILQNAELDSLKFSACEREETVIKHDITCEKMPKFSQFSIYLMNDEKSYYGFEKLPVFSLMDVAKYEFISMHVMNFFRNDVKFYTTPMFESFITNNFYADLECTTELTDSVFGNVAIMFWEKESTKFDNRFYSMLLEQLKENYVFSYDPRIHNSIPPNYSWYSIVPTVSDISNCKKVDSNDFSFKRKRVAAPSFTMDYDTLFKENKKIQLKVSFKYFLGLAVNLTSNSDYLGKLTFLSLHGDASYNIEFFHILFRCCENLVTLAVERTSSSSFSTMSSLLRSIPLSKTLKNIRLVDKKLDFGMIFTAFSQTKTLENVNLVATALLPSTLSDPTLFIKNCNNLYNIFIEGAVSDNSGNARISLFHELKKRFGRHGLNIDITTRHIRRKFCFSPYNDVFHLHPIKPPFQF